MDLKYERMKAEVERLKRESARAEGALEQLMNRLQEEFDCESIEEAQAKLEELDRAAKKAEKKCDKAWKEFEENFGHLLEEE